MDKYFIGRLTIRIVLSKNRMVTKLFGLRKQLDGDTRSDKKN
jgi:hypothetical protein